MLVIISHMKMKSQLDKENKETSVATEINNDQFMRICVKAIVFGKPGDCTHLPDCTYGRSSAHCKLNCRKLMLEKQ